MLLGTEEPSEAEPMNQAVEWLLVDVAFETDEVLCDRKRISIEESASSEGGGVLELLLEPRECLGLLLLVSWK